MPSYTFLSGSTVDNVTKTTLDMLASGESYVGFARGTGDYQWGTLALINVEAQIYNGSNYITTNNASQILATASSSAVSGIFNDLKPIINSNPVTGNNAYIIGSDLDNAIEIKLIEANESWLLIEGLPNDYYITLNKAISGDGLYIVRSLNGGSLDPAQYVTPRFKIQKKLNDYIPTYTIDCNLYGVDEDNNETLIAENLQRSITILGETQVTGLIDISNAGSAEPVYNLTQKDYLQTHSFKLVDLSGNPLIENLIWVSSDSANTYSVVNSSSNSEMFLTFAVSAAAGYTQHIKISVGANQVNSFAIWNEYLPYDTNILNSDSNPPGLEISYLRTPLIERSIFDVNGLYNIPSSAVKFVKELYTTAEYALYNNMTNYGISGTSITLSGAPSNHYGSLSASAGNGENELIFDGHNFVVGDLITIPIDPIYNINGLTETYKVIGVDYGTDTITVSGDLNLSTYLPIGYTLESSASPINAVLHYAYTNDIKTALRHGLTNVMIDLSVPISGTNIYDGLYRQLFICYNPKDSSGVVCDESSYNQPIYNSTTHTTEIGTLLYVANKVPVYRKYINMATENFTLIL